MAVRKIIEIDEDKCNGCGICIPNCAEGALQIIDNKARLISDLFCDGLGACIGHCPQGAIKITERESLPYDEFKVMENIVKAGKNTIAAHLKHLKDHNETVFYNQALQYLKDRKIEIPQEINSESGHKQCGCPGSQIMDLRNKTVKNPDNSLAAVKDVAATQKNHNIEVKLPTNKLNNWPIQLRLINPNASFFDDSDILIAADCVLAAYPEFNGKFLGDKILIIFCPKLDDDLNEYIEKLGQIFATHSIKSISVLHMEVPCCYGIENIVNEALNQSGKKMAVKKLIISISGELV